VCNVEDYSTAKALENIGVDYIGIHMIWTVKKHKAALLSECKNRLVDALPVVVTRTKDPKVLDEIMSLKPPCIQLHAGWSCEELRPIKRRMSKDAQLIGVIELENAQSARVTSRVATECDFVLFDKPYAGRTRSPIDFGLLAEALREAGSFTKSFFISGGLTPDNVSNYIRAFKPYGVDVQTGVEVDNKPGLKDLTKVRRFVENARFSE
jgi:phosphoribosylanthranilate isomerase